MSSAAWASTILQKTQTPPILSFHPTFPLSLSTSLTIPFPHLAATSFPKSLNFNSQPPCGIVSQAQPEDEEEPVIGDCLVYEEGIFNDPFLENWRNEVSEVRKSSNKDANVSPENLIPEGWLDVQKQINITNKERRKLRQEMEFGRSVQKRRQALMPLNSEEFEEFKKEKLKQLNPVVLDSPKEEYFSEDDKCEKGDNSRRINGREDSQRDTERSEERINDRDDDKERHGERISGRVAPRNPRLAVYGGGLEDVSAIFDSGSYDHRPVEKSDGRRKLFSKEEKSLMNRRVPDLAVATSGKWHPLHTLAASGEFYLATSLLKHNLDINAPDKNGLTAVHKSILAKKQAVFNFLLRESANPFVRDDEGATLLHYAVYAASSQMIKILLLYNVDINLQDNDGWAPLHLAVQSRRTDIVRLLLIKGADRTLKNREGLSALDLCLYSGRDVRTYELMKLLLRIN